MVREAKLEKTEHGLIPKEDGWFVLHARDALWRPGEGQALEGTPNKFVRAGDPR